MIENKRWLLALLVAFGGCSGDADHSSDTVPAGETVTIAGMSNTVRVGNLLFGGQPSQDALRTLAEQGYRAVVTTRGADELTWDEKALVDSLGLRFVSIPMPYPITAITDEQLDAFDALMESTDEPMVLHCGSGNRVAGLWTVWLVERKGLDPDEALRLGDRAGMTRIRPVVEERLKVPPIE